MDIPITNRKGVLTFNLGNNKCTVNVKCHGCKYNSRLGFHYRWKVRIAFQSRTASFDYVVGVEWRENFQLQEFIKLIKKDYEANYLQWSVYSFVDAAAENQFYRNARAVKSKIDYLFPLRRLKFFQLGQ